MNLDQQTFHCFKCGRSGNALGLWAQATRQTPYDAAIDLCQRLGVVLPNLTGTRGEESVAPSVNPGTMEPT